jgi:hypothetical protein
MATHGSSSEDDGDDGDNEDTSSDEEVESMVAEYVKKIFKYVNKVKFYGYNIHLREGRQHQHIKFTGTAHMADGGGLGAHACGEGGLLWPARGG